MAALLEAARASDFPAAIALVISNRPDALGLDRASATGVATLVIDHTRYGLDRARFEAAIEAQLEKWQIEIVCLAGFLRLLTPPFVERWAGRLVNVHPALLPAFKGLDTHARALAAGVKLHGATVHFVVPEMDAGPIIAQGAVPVLEDDTPGTLGERVLAVEHRIYPLALRLLADDRLRVVEGRVRVEGAAPAQAALLHPAD